MSRFFKKEKDVQEKGKIPKPTVFDHFSPRVPQGYMEGSRSGRDLITAGEYERAEKLLIELSHKFKDQFMGNYLFLLQLADAFFLQGKLDVAEKLYRDLIDANVAFAHAYYGLGLVLRRTNREDESTRLFEIAKRMTGKEDIPDYLPRL